MKKNRIFKLKCGCKVMENGWYYSKCKYHENLCNFYQLGCKKKKIKESDYCKKHKEQMDADAGYWMDAFGGSDF